MSRIIELVSDTITLPTEEMLSAMAGSPLGDDVYGLDPTVNELEALAAARVGKEAALFVPTGTMANLVCCMTHCPPGSEVILESECHIYYYEVGGVSRIAGLIPRLVRGVDGVLDPSDVEAAIRPADIHFAKPALLCLENTHNRAGGVVTPVSRMKELRAVADKHGLSIHMDGARVFNAADYLGVDVSEIAAEVDSLMFCFSKGLSAPVGSAIAGSREFIARARKNRKLLGGGMRQAGVLAAAAKVALEKMVSRLSEDHSNARLLAELLVKIEKCGVRPEMVQTNIVPVDVTGFGMSAQDFCAALKERYGISSGTLNSSAVRFVLNRHVSADDVAVVADAIGELAQG